MVKPFPSVVELLQEHGPLLSSDVSKHYRDMGVKESAARQRVNRRSDEVKTLYGLPFPKGAQFLYLDGEFGDQRFYLALIGKLKETNSAYGAAIGGMLARNGICLADHWPIVCGSPNKQKGHISHGKIQDGLRQAKLLEEMEIAGIGHCLMLNSRFFATSTAEFRSRLTIEHILKGAVRDWAIRLGWSSKGAIEVFDADTLPQYSTMSFDLVGPSYLQALTTRSKGKFKNGHFVCDVVFGNVLTEEELAGFLKKIDTLKYLKRLGRFQPMLLADGYTQDALMKLRGLGVIAATPESLFGRQVAEALAELLEVLKRSAEIAIGNPDRIEDLFNKLDGWQGGLRGALFEMIVGHIVKVKNGGSIDIGVLVTDHRAQKKADIDVRLVSETDVICYECKGHGPDVSVPLEEVKTWLEEKVPIMRAAHNYESRFDGLHPTFEFWATGVMGPEVIAYLEERKASIRKYDIVWRNSDDIVSMAGSLKNKTLHKLLQRFYRKDPLS